MNHPSPQPGCTVAERFLAGAEAVTAAATPALPFVRDCLEEELHPDSPFRIGRPFSPLSVSPPSFALLGTLVLMRLCVASGRHTFPSVLSFAHVWGPFEASSASHMSVEQYAFGSNVSILYLSAFGVPSRSFKLGSRKDVLLLSREREFWRFVFIGDLVCSLSLAEASWD